MNTVANRANAIFAFSSFVIFVLLFGNVISTFFLPSNPTVTISGAKVERTRPQYGSGYDQAFIRFNLKSDLRSLFNWNTKLLFVFVTAEYSTPENPINQVVLWDRIIQTEEEAELDLKAEASEYILTDMGQGLRNNNITLTFNWNLVPITGILTTTKKGSQTFKFPSEYTS